MSEEKSYCIKKINYPSSDGKTQIAGYFVEPEGDKKIVGVVQISHGMCEYFLRYENFAAFLCENGYAVCGNDHLGHGYTAESDDDLGFTAEGGGSAFMVKDVHRMTLLARERYGDVPVVLLGHSMGSFIARLCISNFGKDYDAAIIMGTGGPDAPYKLGKAIAKVIMEKKGEHHRSRELEKIAFTGYTKRCPKGSHPRAWITRDEAILDKYANDKFCNYCFTVRGFYDLFDLLEGASKKDWAKKVPSELPVLLISGMDDPVGGYGKGVKKIHDRLEVAGVKNLELMLYPDNRHEVLNELEREKVYNDILDWLEETVE